MSSLGPLPDINAAPDSSIKDTKRWQTDFAMCLSVPNPINVLKQCTGATQPHEDPKSVSAPLCKDTPGLGQGPVDNKLHNVASSAPPTISLAHGMMGTHAGMNPQEVSHHVAISTTSTATNDPTIVPVNVLAVDTAVDVNPTLTTATNADTDAPIIAEDATPTTRNLAGIKLTPLHGNSIASLEPLTSGQEAAQLNFRAKRGLPVAAPEQA